MVKPIRILLADDDMDDCNFFEESLADAGIQAELTTVNNGQKLMDIIYLNDDLYFPDIIFLDINMPRKDGKICLREIRANQKFACIPIIIFSTSSNPKDIEETYINGANLYVSKSVFFEDETGSLKKIFNESWNEELMKKSREKFIFNNDSRKN